MSFNHPGKRKRTGQRRSAVTHLGICCILREAVHKPCLSLAASPVAAPAFWCSKSRTFWCFCNKSKLFKIKNTENAENSPPAGQRTTSASNWPRASVSGAIPRCRSFQDTARTSKASKSLGCQSLIGGFSKNYLPMTNDLGHLVHFSKTDLAPKILPCLMLDDFDRRTGVWPSKMGRNEHATSNDKDWTGCTLQYTHLAMQKKLD